MFNLSSSFQGGTRRKERKTEWRMFHAKDFRSLMHPCFTLCRICGIFPYKINATSFKISKPYLILLIVTICSCCLCSLIMQQNFFISDDYMIIVLYNLMRICTLVFGNFIIIVTFILTVPRMSLLQTIMKISSRLPSESYEKLSKLIHAKDIIGFFYSVYIILTLIIFKSPINRLLEIYIIIAIFQMDMLYMNCVCVLKACFTRINDNLISMRIFIANNESSVHRLNYHNHRNPFLIMELKALKKQHLTISDAVQMLNIVFSLQLLGSVAIILFTITICIYLHILVIYHVVNTNFLIIVLYHALFLLYLGYFFIKILLIVWACETGRAQAQQISISIHDIFNVTTDEKIKDELQIFSLQLLHCDNTFSAKCFTIDAKLLAAIVSSVSVYLLIILQFMNISHSCVEKTANSTGKISFISISN